MSEEMARMEEFSRDISKVINRHSMENPSGTPDFILGDLLTSVLASYNDAVQRRAEWRAESVELPVSQKSIDAINQNVTKDRQQSYFHDVLDSIVNEQISHRQKYFEYLMANPGFIATFGEDFVVEYRDMDLSTIPDPTYNELNEYRVVFTQEVRFYRREVWDKIQSAKTENLADKVRELRTLIRSAQESGDGTITEVLTQELKDKADELSDLGLRIDANGNLESI